MAFQCTSPENGVFSLLTDLCTKTSSKYCNQNRISQKRLMKKMRSSAYEIILKKSSTKFTTKEGQPIADLISYYFVYQHSVRNIAEFKRSVELKKIISTLRKTDFGDITCDVLNVIRFLIGVSNTINEDMSAEIFQNPFTFGLFEEMLPKPRREVFGSPEPYSYFPSHVFELPFSLKRDDAALDRHKSQTYTEYTVESFDSSSFLIDSSHSPLQGQSDVKSFLSPMSMASLTSTHLSPYSEDAMLNYPRLMAPRDLRIPTSSTHVKISLPSTDIKTDVKEIFSASSNQASIDIWELATQIDKGIPDDIWEIVAKMPKIEERQLINSSSREMCLWRETYAGDSSYLDVISEKQFIRHIMYLIFGVETKSFPFSRETNSFYMKEDLVLECISKEHIRGYISTLLLVGTYYIRLYNFSFNQSLEDHFHNHGLVYEAAREVVRRYLLEFRLVATEIYENCCKASNEGLNCMPTLLQILFHMEPLKYEMETMAAMYKVDQDAKTSLPHGAELMSYLFNEISLITHKNTTYTVYNSFYTVCKVYFKFIERYIFEGELDDIYNEFFIRKDNQYVNCRSKRYWDKGFHITQSVAIPRFLQSLAKCILLCGKSLRLLKLCNPSDPLVLLISSDHPSVTCCASFEDLERQQQVLDVYRTRCLFVTGELVTFDQILLKREAERKAFTEMASLKQAETMEKIIAERKRLAQLIIAEKQHSLRVLEAAMAEAKAAKSKAKQRERRRYELENAAEKATEEVDSKLKDVERNKLMAYYSKLNMEVEKSKMHTEWKIKRLQLDQSRMQLLSTEERNLKREKLELEHQKNEEIMAMSIQSIDYDKLNEETVNKEGIETNLESFTDKMHESVHSVLMQDVEEIIDVRECEESTPIAQTSTVMNAICNVAKSFFGVSKWNENQCDNNKQLDEQGNIVNTKTEDTRYTTSSSDIGSKLDAANDNLQFHKAKKEAMINKQNVMSHEFGHIDNENNTVIKHSSLLNLESVDEENNVRDNWSTFDYAKRNKLKVLGSEFDIIPTQSKIIVSEPRTDAQKEALLNKQKVLGVDFNLPAERIILREPANQAQEEAVVNKQKVLGVEYNLPAESMILREPANQAQEEAVVNKQKVLGVEYNLPAEPMTLREPANQAQEEAIVNKQKVLGVEYNLPAEPIILKEPANQAQEEAIVNKQKVLGVKYNLPAEPIILREPENQAQEEAVVNKQKVLGVHYNLPAEPMILREPLNQAQEEAIVNKQKVLGVEYNLPAEPIILKEPANQAQEEAIVNKQKVLGVEYNLPAEQIILREPLNQAQELAVVNKQKVLGHDIAAVSVNFREPVTEAQEKAVRNKNKVMSSEYENTLAQSVRKESAKRSGLTLNLKPYGETSVVCSLGATPNAGVVTPGDLFPRLDLETPTTADIPQEAAITADIFTPRSETGKDLEPDKPKEKDFITSDGFNFTLMVDDENVESEITSEHQTADMTDISQSKNLESPETKIFKTKYNLFNILDGSYTLDDFDPFGIRDLKNFSQDYLSCKMDLDMSTSCYTHPSIIMEEVKKKPYANIFASHFDSEKEGEKKINCDNIATLTACLQRSVMLPLTYQLEVVNNSILTYFLVNLDMYEHMRSLKDYFFLMDGEFSRSICHNLFTKLVKTLNPQELLNFATLHNILDKALGSSISHVHKFSENLSFTITESPLSFQHSSPDVLQCLSLTYTVSWPLNIILSQEALLRYAKVFQFLIKMRRIFWVLGEDFEALKLSVKLSKQHSRKLLKSPQYISVQIYRHIMASMIRALDNYIVTTCILSSWKEFENDLKKARTLDDLNECHVVYIKKVLFRCLLNNRSTPVMKLLNDIFTVILKFSRVLKAGEWQQKQPNGCFTHTSFAQLVELFHLFEKLAKYLHKVVTKLMECGYQRHLVELLTMVNLNGYYEPEKAKDDHNSSVKSTV